jgi:hypothetical protein
MSKVLIGFLGTDPVSEKGTKREYRTAKYKFEDPEYCKEISFVTVAIFK